MPVSVRKAVLYAAREVGKNYPDFKIVTTLSEEAQRQVNALNAVEQLEGYPAGTKFEVVKITIDSLDEDLNSASMKKKTSDMADWISSMNKK